MKIKASADYEAGAGVNENTTEIIEESPTLPPAMKDTAQQGGGESQAKTRLRRLRQALGSAAQN